MPSFKRMRSSLYDALAKNVVSIGNINALPIEYQLTLRGREARANNPQNPMSNERMVLFNQNNIAIFSSSLDLRVLHESEFWIGIPLFFLTDNTCHKFSPLQEMWMYERFDIAIWNHFGNEWRHMPLISEDRPPLARPGPRTTNHAEGWHNRLNHDFGHPYPAYNKFLHWLQEAHHANQVRIHQLHAGAEPCPRDPTYVHVDNNVAFRKTAFVDARAFLPIDADQAALINLSVNYLRHIMHQLG